LSLTLTTYDLPDFSVAPGGAFFLLVNVIVLGFWNLTL
jgi:hypothetical protein